MEESHRLNERQIEAIEATNGPVMVIAGAGTGKTSVLTKRICNLISQGVSPSSILAITFTNKAAQEMKDRVVDLVGPYGRYMWISTFHSACVRILKEDANLLGFRSNFTIYDNSDSKRVIDRIVKLMGLDSKRFDSRALRTAISTAKSLLMAPDMLNTNFSAFSNRIGEIYVAYQNQLKQNNAMDFDDLLNNTVKLLSDYEDVKFKWHNRFNYILVDEYQDTNKAQTALISLLVNENKNIFIVGDFDQSIYKFRGADPTNFLVFEQIFEKPKVIILDQNYRSVQNILDGANAVIKNNFSKQTKHLHSDFGPGKKIKVISVEDEFTEANFIAEEIQKLYLSKIKYSDIAVMYRTNGQSRLLESALSSEKIPYKVVGGMRFFDRKEIKDALSYLRVVVNPTDSVSIERTINLPKRGIGPKAVAELLHHASLHSISFLEAVADSSNVLIGPKTQAGCKEYFQIISELKDMYEKGVQPAEIAERLQMISGIREIYELDKSVEAEGKLENLDELLNLASEFETLDEMLDAISLTSELDDTGAINEVSLMTLHAAKGLEFDTVFLTGMEEGILPHLRSLDDPESLEEERRLCYVGITRAKRNLYLTVADFRSQWGSSSFNLASRFIDEIPQNVKKDIDLTSIKRGKFFSDSSKVSRIKTQRWESSDQLDFENYVSNNSKEFIDNEYKKLDEEITTVNNSTNTKTSKEDAGLYKTTGAEKLGLQVGDLVVHSRWGEGVIGSISGSGADMRAEIQFVTGTTKTFILAMTPLKRA
jgi:DNA helicase-2/ATP-dependent DNA helicase PcrA